MPIYNLKTDGDQYRITKFDVDLNVESSYLCTETECECPAGSRPSCRHRQMLPLMLAAKLANRDGYYDYDNDQVLVPHGVVDAPDDVEDEGEEVEFTAPPSSPPNEPHSTAVSVSDFDSEDGGSNPPVVAKPHPFIGKINRRI